MEAATGNERTTIQSKITSTRELKRSRFRKREERKVKKTPARKSASSMK